MDDFLLVINWPNNKLMCMDNDWLNKVPTILSLLSSVAIIISAFFAIYQWKKT